ncbi:glucosaminidase domain-containing protein [Lacrimispora indolis]|uniref:glucosaminidase domain-containing protein n=1 Tax=Lacrimispora indolis TaxID=69825 RepID=UPI0004288A34|nr:glucosaminidase domain-containing protein [[Clostridium] methoxybenzovorans]
MTNEQKTFIEKIAAAVKKNMGNYGIEVASPIIAQAIIESNWGKSGLSANYHNYFGLKCGSAWKGASVNMATKEEYKPGVLTSINDNFRVFGSLEEGVKGYFDFISVSRYANLKGVTDPQKYVENIKADGYATSSIYVNTIMNCVRTCNLTAYDVASLKSEEVIAWEVIAGKWGNGEARKASLTAAGYNYASIQAKVNGLAAGSAKPALKSNEAIAKEVIAGEWGNGQDRKNKLTAAGYDAAAIQAIVNKKL